mgnify:CR=1 FL=1
MREEETIIAVGRHKGEWDFAIRATIQDLAPTDMDELRRMLVVAIGVAEDMWRQSRMTSNLAGAA